MKVLRWMLMLIVSAELLASPGVRVGVADRLAALDPVDSAAYFRLGEDVAELAQDDEDRALAVRLFTLADHLDPHRWRRGAILAIRPLVREGTVHRLLDANLTAWSSHVAYLPESMGGQTQREEVRRSAVDAISGLRSGDRKALRAGLATPGAARQIDAMASRLPGDSTWMLQMAQGERFGSLGLSERAIIGTLEVQGELLRSQHRPWSVILQVRTGAPMTVIDPVPLADIFGIDPQQRIFRNGAWLRVED